MRFTFLLLLLFICQGEWANTLQDTLVVGYTSAPPFIIETDLGLDGINYRLWDRISEELDQPYKLQKMGFSDMMAALKNGDIDVSINPLTITSERNKEVDFTHSYYASNSTIAVSGKSSFGRIFTFIRGFMNLNFLKGLLILIIIIISFGLVGWAFERRINPEDFRTGYKGIWDGIWWSAVTLTTVGYGDKSPKSRKGKIVALILMFTGLLFISGLTASIASSLTVQEIKSVDTFEEFKESRVGTVERTSSAGFLRERFFKDIVLFNGLIPGLEALQSGKVSAFVYDEPILRYTMSQDERFSNLQILPIQFDIQYYAFGISKDRPELTEYLSQQVLEITESTEWQILLNEYGLSEF